jgi:hypothetical protein
MAISIKPGKTSPQLTRKGNETAQFLERLVRIKLKLKCPNISFIV